MFIFSLVLGWGQIKPAWTACPPGVDNQGGGQDIPGQLAPPPPRRGQANRGWLQPRGQAVQGAR